MGDKLKIALVLFFIACMGISTYATTSTAVLKAKFIELSEETKSKTTVNFVEEYIHHLELFKLSEDLEIELKKSTIYHHFATINMFYDIIIQPPLNA